MMNARISMEDWERLSAYLDNRLSPAENSEIEKQLTRQADLQAELNELQKLRLALRSLPQKKAPHNYTLKSPIKEPKTSRFSFLVPAFSLASAAAAILLVVSYVFQFNQPGVMVEPPQAAMLEIAEDAALPDSTPAGEPEIIFWGGAPGSGGDGAEGMGGYGGGVGGGPAALSAAEALPEEAARIAVDETAPQAKSPPAEAEAAAKQLTEQGKSAPAEAQPNLIVGIRPTEQRGQILSAPDPLLTQPQAAGKTSIGIAISSLQIGLALLTVAFALSAYWLSRKSRQLN